MLYKLKKIGEGNTAEIFQMDNNRILKLFQPGYSKESMLHEYQNHQAVSVLVDNVPKLYETVEGNGRFGYIMEQIKGNSLAELLLNEQTFEKALEMFVRIHKSWNKEASTEVISYKTWMKNMMVDKESNAALLEKVNRLPDGNILCHGDFHPYNIIVTVEDNPIVIDFANICRGPKAYDVARTYFLMEEAGAKQIAELYLQRMNLYFNDIQKYYEVICQLRKHERNENKGE